jgi:excisionase family DNA binding protein
VPKPSTESIESRLLTIKQTAAYANATVWFIRNLIWSRSIPFAKFGNRLLIDRKDIDAYIDAEKSGVAQ